MRESITAEAWQEVAGKGLDPPGCSPPTCTRSSGTASPRPTPRSSSRRSGPGIQLDRLPARAAPESALRLPRVNLFIADDVGLGKTIEAGPHRCRELLLRKKVERHRRRLPAVGAPAVAGRAGDALRPALRDPRPEFVARGRQERGFGVNPWTTHSRFIVSHRAAAHRGLRRATLRDWLGDFRPKSLLILDEAHHAAPASGSEVRHRLEDHPRGPRPGRALRAPALPLGDAAQRPLQQLLRAARDPRPAALHARRSRAPKQLDTVMVRRLKSDLRAIGDGTSFPLRRIVKAELAAAERLQVCWITDDVPGLVQDLGSAELPELELARMLARYTEFGGSGERPRQARFRQPAEAAPLEHRGVPSHLGEARTGAGPRDARRRPARGRKGRNDRRGGAGHARPRGGGGLC